MRSRHTAAAPNTTPARTPDTRPWSAHSPTCTGSTACGAIGRTTTAPTKPSSLPGYTLICRRQLNSSRWESLLRHDRGQRFTGRVPRGRKGGNAGAGGDDPARDGAGGVDVAAPGDRDPQALVQVV